MIDLTLDTTQRELVASVVTALGREAPLHAPGLGHDLLPRAAELGWLTVTLDTELGGVGLQLAEEALVFRELGRHLTSTSLLAAALATRVAWHLGDRDLIGRLASGRWAAGIAEHDSETGEILLWTDRDCDFMVCVDVRHGTVGLAEYAGLAVASRDRTIDPSYSRVRGMLRPGGALRAVSGTSADDVIDAGAVLVAAMLTGVAEQTRDQSVEYASTRVQFGRPIGVHQAVKHRCADMAARAEASWAQTSWAALAEGAGRAFEVSAARVVASSSALENSRDNIQNHGGIGYTAEHDAHRYLKRAHLLDRMCGPATWHLERTFTARRE